MVSSINASNRFFPSHFPVPHLNFHSFPSLSFLPIARRRHQPEHHRQKHLLYASLFVVAKGLSIQQRRTCLRSGFSGMCKKTDSEGDFDLEAEILRFMHNSENPNTFPTRKELIDAGRMDLVEAIVNQGGWLSLGWDSDEDEDCSRVSNSTLSNEIYDDYDQESDNVSASSTGRSLEIEAEDDTGIEGILSRLEKERSSSFGFGLSEKGNYARPAINHSGEEPHYVLPKNSDRAGLERSRRAETLSPNNGVLNGAKLNPTSFSDSDSSHKPETWRHWSIHRAGFADTEFEAAEISIKDNRTSGVMDVTVDEVRAIKEGASEPLDRRKKLNSFGTEINHNHIKTRIQRLESELSRALHVLKSNGVVSQGRESSSEELQKLSDAWEFQETEIMNARDRLRSTRAKLAVLEGKMSLAIADAKKIVEEKQKRIDETRKALRLLRTACIVWPNPASEVFLVGSFDGWASQRKMEKSSSGIFSIYLKLYPGRYEIKFIVDGAWKIDPLRPIANNNGYENNILIIT